MKMIKTICLVRLAKVSAWAMVAAMLFAGCSLADTIYDVAGVLPADGVLRVQQAGVVQATSRADDSYSNLPFALYVDNKEDASFSYANVYMKYEGGLWNSYVSGATGAAPQKMDWKSSGSSITVTAYSPYGAAVKSDTELRGAVPTTQMGAGGIIYDLLYARQDVEPDATVQSGSIFYDRLSKGINVRFEHLLSLITVNLSFGDTAPLTLADVDSILIQGTNTAWTKSLEQTDGAAPNTATPAKADIVMWKGTTEYNAEIVPQTTDYTILIKTRKGDYLYHGSGTFVFGKQYTLTLRFGHNGVTLKDISVSDWNDSGSAINGSANIEMITNKWLIDLLHKQGVEVGKDGNIHVKEVEVKQQLEKVKTLIFPTDGGVTSLDGIQYLPNLEYLKCARNRLSELDVSKNTELTRLSCFENSLSSLDVSKNTKLTRLYCYQNSLSELNVSKNTELTDLSCSHNSLSKLDVSNNTKLTDLSCSHNSLSSLDVSKNTKLTRLYCYQNSLSKLDVSNNTELTDLSCEQNRLSELDVSNNTELTRLTCFENRLSELDVSKNTKLTDLSCGHNSLSKLDVSKNTELTGLSCSENRLLALDVSNNTKLIDLFCGQNSLSKLDVSKNTELTRLSCEYNSLSKLDVSKNTELTDLNCEQNSLSALDISKLTKLEYLQLQQQRPIKITLTITEAQKTRFGLYDNDYFGLIIVSGSSVQRYNTFKIWKK